MHAASSGHRARFLIHTLLVLLALAPASAAQMKPTIEPSTAYSQAGVRFYATGSGPGQPGSMAILSLIGGFLPKETHYDSINLVRDSNQVYAVLTKGGSELDRWPMLVEFSGAVFTRMRPAGTPGQYTFQEAGDYVLNLQIDNQAPFWHMPFRVTLDAGDDPFDPKMFTHVDGLWNDWGFLAVPEGGRPEANPSFECFVRGGSFNTSGTDEDLFLHVREGQDMVFTSRKSSISASVSALEWERREFDLMFPKDQGGGPIQNQDLLKKDGTYTVTLERAGKITSVWSYSVAGGKVVPHARQAPSHEPHADYLMPRYPGSQNRKTYDAMWMQRLSPDDAREALGRASTVAAGPSAAERTAWRGTQRADPKRATRVVQTGIPMRMDATLAVGDELVAFGTGSTRGVAYLRVGEDTQQSIPNGQEYDAKSFAVCGRKLILRKSNQLFVYDTDTDTTVAIPEDVITLARYGGGLSQPNIMHADGMLVVTANDPKKVQDRVVIKVVDVSGDEPRILGLSNAGFVGSDVTSVVVDAETGQVAVGVPKLNAIFVGDIAEGGKLKSFDLSGNDSIGKCQLQLSGGRVAYRDSSGKAKFRILDLQAGQVLAPGTLGGYDSRYALVGDHFAYPTEDSRGSNHAYAVGAFGGSQARPGKTGEGLDKTGGNLGMGHTVGLTPSGAIFLAGNGKGGIGSGEFLQAASGQAGTWDAMRDPDGAPIPGTDVVVGRYLAAFKGGKRNDTTVGYILFGDTVTLP